MTAGVEYTIDELAREAGTTVRSLRVYHERGVLPPPQVKGRTGFYGADHLNRVRTISRLLDRGIKLNGIKELLNAWDRGDDLGDILGVAEPEAAEAPAVDAGDTIAATELAELYHDVPNGLARVVAAGLYEPVDAATYRIADRRLAHSLDQLTAAGVPADEVLGELEKLRTDAERIARRYVDLFRRTVWASFQESDRGPAQTAELAQRLEATKDVPAQTAAELVNRLVARYLDQDTELSEALPES
ncbi:MerR family transcriptional regulator [Nocardia beijingensis]|uniref:MerR family transcriptional regulator n=1 Tax=Nocardia beijingensis TaxID=95162 RepID=UPI0018960FD3|nr:MerR family transcriptional regulator [Nocardia beijingensis]MBF6467297.1 MerR family transcriptional regulator [Nocardia beijingensis]